MSRRSFFASAKIISCWIFSNRALSLNCSETEPFRNNFSALSASFLRMSNFACPSVTAFRYSKSSIIRRSSPFFTIPPSLKFPPTSVTRPPTETRKSLLLAEVISPYNFSCGVMFLYSATAASMGQTFSGASIISGSVLVVIK